MRSQPPPVPLRCEQLLLFDRSNDASNIVDTMAQDVVCIIRFSHPRIAEARLSPIRFLRIKRLDHDLHKSGNFNSTRCA